jgi:hypothetical protein
LGSALKTRMGVSAYRRIGVVQSSLRASSSSSRACVHDRRHHVCDEIRSSIFIRVNAS